VTCLSLEFISRAQLDPGSTRGSTMAALLDRTRVALVQSGKSENPFITWLLNDIEILPYAAAMVQKSVFVANRSSDLVDSRANAAQK
jgi:hypothetical protein